MNGIFESVVRKKRLIVALFALAFFICLFLRSAVGVNYDLNDYLPDGVKSTESLEVLKREFGGGIPNARVMIKNVTVPQALDYKQRLEKVEGVTEVSWLDDAAQLTQPIETLERGLLDTYYKDGAALYTVTVDEDKLIPAVNGIRGVIGEDGAMSGTAVTTAVATDSAMDEIILIAAGGILFALILLLLTTRSWLHPVLILAGLGVAVVINAGTNIVFSEISFVTNAAGSILQLAVSLDYSVFLIHRYEEYSKDGKPPAQAMVQALRAAAGSIFSSGMTTVIGFAALTFMQFRIGFDLGLALAKGIVISLITVFVFMPALLLLADKAIRKTRHRRFLPQPRRFGKVVCKIMLPVACVFALVTVPAYIASNSNSYYYGGEHIFNEQTKFGADTASIEQTYGKSDTYVLLVPKRSTATQIKLSAELKSIKQVRSIVSYVDRVGAQVPIEYLDKSQQSLFFSENYSRMLISVDAEYEGEEAFKLVETVRKTATKYYPDDCHLAGQGVSTYDLMKTVTTDMLKVNIIAIAAVFLVLLIMMKSVTLPVLLVLAIETAIWVNLSIPYFSGEPIFYMAYLIISSIQLGATVDYAILMTDRYKELRRDMHKKQAITQTVTVVTIPILTSGSVLTVVGLLLGICSTHGLLSQLGYFIGFGALCSLFAVLFALPGLLYLLDGVIRRTTMGLSFIKRQKHKKVEPHAVKKG